MKHNSDFDITTALPFSLLCFRKETGNLKAKSDKGDFNFYFELPDEALGNNERLPVIKLSPAII